MIKLSVTLVLLLAILLAQTTSCIRADDRLYELRGPDDLTHLVYFYKRDATYEQKEFFQNTIVHKPHPEGRGYDLQDGVIDMFSVRNSEFDGYGINFSINATSEQRKRLKDNIESSPTVYRVYENVVPNEIKDL